MVKRVWQGEYIPHAIYDHVFTALVLIGIDGDLRISLSRYYVKPNISCIHSALIICPCILLKGPVHETVHYGDFSIFIVYWSPGAIKS